MTAPAPSTQAAAIVEALVPHLPLALGSLCVWGDWFGKPLDNQHIAVAVRVGRGVLVIDFHRREVLKVWTPRDWKLELDAPPSASRFVIGDADRVEWGWFYYGRPELPENWFEEHHWREAQRIEASTTWTRPILTLAPSADEPAVIFL